MESCIKNCASKWKKTFICCHHLQFKLQVSAWAEEIFWMSSPVDTVQQIPNCYVDGPGTLIRSGLWMIFKMKALFTWRCWLRNRVNCLARYVFQTRRLILPVKLDSKSDTFHSSISNAGCCSLEMSLWVTEIYAHWYLNHTHCCSEQTLCIVPPDPDHEPERAVSGLAGWIAPILCSFLDYFFVCFFCTYLHSFNRTCLFLLNRICYFVHMQLSVPSNCTPIPALNGYWGVKLGITWSAMYSSPLSADPFLMGFPVQHIL